MTVDEIKYIRKSDEGLLTKVPMLFFLVASRKNKKYGIIFAERERERERERANHFRFFLENFNGHNMAVAMLRFVVSMRKESEMDVKSTMIV